MYKITCICFLEESIHYKYFLNEPILKSNEYLKLDTCMVPVFVKILILWKCLDSGNYMPKKPCYKLLSFLGIAVNVI